MRTLIPRELKIGPRPHDLAVFKPGCEPRWPDPIALALTPKAVICNRWGAVVGDISDCYHL